MRKTALQHKISTIKPSGYLDYREYLGAVYQLLKEHHENYSYIKFTEYVGLGACNVMYSIIHGNRSLTSKSAQKVAAHLGLTHKERIYFLNMIALGQAKDGNSGHRALEKLWDIKAQALPTALDRHHLEFFRDWYNGAIL